MSGVDWDLVHERYAALLPRVRTRAELSDVIWEMHGELGTSHAYEIGGDHRKPPQYRRGFLGADLAWDEGAGGYRIRRASIAATRGTARSTRRWRSRDSTCTKATSSPQSAASRSRATLSPDELLVNTAGRDVAAHRGRARKNGAASSSTPCATSGCCAIAPGSKRTAPTFTSKRSGRVGYLHIPDMGPWGFSEFHRGFLSEFNREGLIVDVRYNRGGHVSPLLLEKLVRKRVGYDVSRYGPPLPYPPESVAGPMVALTNQFAGSDGDIFSHCLQALQTRAARRKADLGRRDRDQPLPSAGRRHASRRNPSSRSGSSTSAGRSKTTGRIPTSTSTSRRRTSAPASIRRCKKRSS